MDNKIEENIFENMTREEKEVLLEANTKREWESDGQWLKRKEFLLKMLSYHKEHNLQIDVEKFCKMGHMYYNVKYLSCSYNSQILEEMKKYEES
ncbi:hypothetical protein PGSY75_1125900 [Plasmodium gaboni]|uniref:XRN2-binding (XTBD) domain-containing protein n=1 Tax=Plasmodium gaboni TaxID=647221 RepID=A0A151LIU2_9APIC|nr:hypothetical protein PGSY75_1125900 [Plasmodium gaboni]XP_028538960.1 conserved Plasmodium protein, unknown function [Plasmodium sp. gorilla clade G2]SOV23337.1 conserved Plasmodium protein, unknown function [Plasmodium sp. DRC-Itaito]KYN98898.1 hypothetical protein PGSY75_1125900 [Plasmodium gaboni]SOV15715.1 conserved Plasmodium protein, unknown function [Plasmodium gaboni]SOV15729.1 conserved Plasmodium protein, unknown function [Plasmodium sp. gorilla clade G2]